MGEEEKQEEEEGEEWEEEEAGRGDLSLFLFDVCVGANTSSYKSSDHSLFLIAEHRATQSSRSMRESRCAFLCVCFKRSSAARSALTHSSPSAGIPIGLKRPLLSLRKYRRGDLVICCLSRTPGEESCFRVFEVALPNLPRVFCFC